MPEFALARSAAVAPATVSVLHGAGDFTVTTGVPAATAFTLSGGTTGNTGVAYTFTVTPNGTMASTVVVSLSATDAALSVPSLTFTAGTSAFQTFTVTRVTDGTTFVAMSNNGGLSELGDPQTLTTAPIVIVPQNPADITTFTLTDPVGGAAVPFSIGQPFKQGDIVNFASPTASVAIIGATAQVIPKNYWPDGSLKFAIISGTATLSAGAVTPITVRRGAPATPGTTLSLATLQATGITASVTAGAFGSATFSNADFGSPFESWVSGDRMSIWVYRKPIGSDTSLVAWLRVKLYVGGAVEVLPWIENGYLLVAGPTSKSATYTFVLGGTTRFNQAIDLPHHCRTPLIGASSPLGGAETAYWLGATQHSVSVLHDVDYLSATELVPAYKARTPAGANSLVGLPTTYTPLQQSHFPGVMGSGGNHLSTQLIPQWDVLYLTYPSALTYKSVIFHGYSAGRYATHYREDPTFATVADRYKPARMSNHPTIQIDVDTPAATGTAPAQWGQSHHPSMGYMAYLVTGDPYFRDEIQFLAGSNQLKWPTWRGAGIIYSQVSGSVRQAAWMFRSLGQALTATPDADTSFRTEYLDILSANVDYYHGRYVGHAQPHNPFGWVEPLETASAYWGLVSGVAGPTPTRWFAASWMQDFFNASMGYIKALKPAFDSTRQTKFDAFYAWKAKSIAGRVGGTGATEFCYRDYAPYIVALSPSPSANWNPDAGVTGPWYADWGATWTATYEYVPPALSKVDGAIRSSPLDPEFAAADAIPALAYAVKHGIAGAELGFARITNADGWAAFEVLLDSTPVRFMKPFATPKWLRGAQVNSVLSIANTKFSLTPIQYTPWKPTDPVIPTQGGNISGAALTAYCGMTFDTRRNSVWVLAGGGHGDYFGNGVEKLDLSADVPQWREWYSASYGPVVGVVPESFPYDEPNLILWPSGYYEDDGLHGTGDGYGTGALPASGHSYNGLQVLKRKNQIVRGPGWSVSPGGSGMDITDAFDASAPIGTRGWFPAQTYPNAFKDYVPTGGPTNQIFPMLWLDPTTDLMYAGNRPNSLLRLDPDPGGGPGGSWTWLGSGQPDTSYSGSACAVDTTRNRVLVTHGATRIPALYNISSNTWETRSYPASAATSVLNTIGQQCPALVYVPVTDAYYLIGPVVNPPDTHFGQIRMFKINADTLDVAEVSLSGNIPRLISALYEGSGSPNFCASMYNRMQFSPDYRGVVIATSPSQDTVFVRLY